MDEKKRGKIEIIVGVILFFIPLATGFWIISTLGTRYAPEFGYLFLMAPILAGLLMGLLSGILLLSGYLRTSGKRTESFSFSDKDCVSSLWMCNFQ